MPARDMTRWQENPDGTYSRTSGRTSQSKVVVSEYDDMSKEELQEALEARGLPKTGNKPELIERLQEDS